MMDTKRLKVAAAGLAIVVLALWAQPCMAGGLVEPGRPILDKILKAVEANDYVSFVSNSNDELKAPLMKQMMQGARTRIVPRMKQGYDCSYLGDLKQQRCQVTLWKLTFKDRGDDALIKLVLKDGKMAGFWVQ